MSSDRFAIFREGEAIISQRQAVHGKPEKKIAMASFLEMVQIVNAAVGHGPQQRS